MALSDLLWACPVCGNDRALSNETATCGACGTRFLRGDGASIRAVAPDGTETVRPPAAWLDDLPDVSTLLGKDPIRRARVSIRPVTGEAPVYGSAGYLNRIEVFGDERPGTLTLHPDHLVAERDELDGAPSSWPLETLTAVQTSSRSLQLKPRGVPLVAFRFLDDSIFLWEQLIRAALRDFYGRTGRGEIREFQPRIETRQGPSSP